MYPSTEKGKFGWWMVAVVVLFVVILGSAVLWRRTQSPAVETPLTSQNPLLLVKEQKSQIKIEHFAVSPRIKYDPTEDVKGDTAIVYRMIDRELGIVCYSEAAVSEMSCVKVVTDSLKDE